MSSPVAASASISGTLFASLLFHLHSHGGMLAQAALFGHFEYTEELSDAEALSYKTHVVLTRWCPVDGGDGFGNAEIDRDDFVGFVRLRRRATHELTTSEVQFLRRGLKVLLITEIDTEVGSNAVEASLFQLSNSTVSAVPLTIANLVSSANRFDDLSRLVSRFGSGGRSSIVEADDFTRAVAPAPALNRYHTEQHATLGTCVASYAADHQREMSLMRELAALRSHAEALAAVGRTDEGMTGP